MKDYLCIGDVLDLSKYDKKSKTIRDFVGKEIYILSANSIKGKDKSGFTLTIEDTIGNNYTISTYSAVLREQLTDLLLNAKNVNGVFDNAIKCTLTSTPVKNKLGTFTERFKLV